MRLIDGFGHSQENSLVDDCKCESLKLVDVLQTICFGLLAVAPSSDQTRCVGWKYPFNNEWSNSSVSFHGNK